jgi:hypothetical protein
MEIGSKGETGVFMQLPIERQVEGCTYPHASKVWSALEDAILNR